MNATTEPTGRSFGQHAWDDTIPAHYEACVVPILELLAPLAAQHDAELTIVDLGCGAGRLAFPAAMAMPEATIIGVDTSSAAVDALEAAADERGVDNVCGALGNGVALPEQAMGVDAVYCIEVFRLLPWSTVWGYLRSIARALLPGGVVRLQFVEGHHRHDLERVTRTLAQFGLTPIAIDRGLVEPSWTFVTARKAT